MPTRTVSFTVTGQAQPGGSKIPGRSKSGKLYVRDDNRSVKAWRQLVAQKAQTVVDGQPLLEGPLLLRLRFHRGRPKSHLGTGRNAGTVKHSAPEWPTTIPDLTKLERAVEDALRRIVWHDDAQVCQKATEKVYAEPYEPDRVDVRVEELVPFTPGSRP